MNNDKKILNMLKSTISISIIFLISFLFTNFNYHFGDNNHIAQLPDLWALTDSNYLNNDFYVHYAKGVTPRFYYLSALMFIQKYIGTETMYYVLTLFSNFLILLITYFVVYDISNKNRLISFVSVLLLCVYYRSFNVGGAGALVDDYLLPQLLATPFILLSLWTAIKNRYFASLFSSILSMMIHPSLALVTLPILLLVVYLRSTNNFNYLKISVFLLLHCLVAYFCFIRFTNTKFLSDDTYIYILAYFRHPHHYIPSFILQNDLNNFLALTSLSWISLELIFRNRKFRTLSNEIKYIRLSYVLCLVILLVGYIFVEIISIREVVEIQTFRIIYLIRWIFVISVPVAVLAVASKYCSARILNKITVVCAVLLIVTNQNIFLKGFMMPDIYLKPLQDKVNLFNYISSHTNNQSIFLTPQSFGEMRIFPKRAIVVDTKTFPFEEKSMYEWYLRVRNIYGDGDFADFDLNYMNITDSKLKKLRQYYGFNYAILFNQTPTNNLVVYKDANYKIVKF